MHLQAIRYPQMRLAKIPWGSWVVRKLWLPKAIVRCAALNASEWGEEVIAPSCSSLGGTSPLTITTMHSFPNPQMSKWQAKKALLLETREGMRTVWTGQVREQLPGQLAGTRSRKAGTSSWQQKRLTWLSRCQWGLSDCNPHSPTTQSSAQFPVRSNQHQERKHDPF